MLIDTQTDNDRTRNGVTRLPTYSYLALSEVASKTAALPEITAMTHSEPGLGNFRCGITNISIQCWDNAELFSLELCVTFRQVAHSITQTMSHRIHVIMYLITNNS